MRAEPGCVEFRTFEDVERGGTSRLVEIYTDTTAFTDHLGLDRVARFRAALEQHSSSTAQALVHLIELRG